MGKMIVEAADLKTRLVRPPSGRAPVSKKGGIALSESGSVLFDPANFLANVGAGKTILKYKYIYKHHSTSAVHQAGGTSWPR
jgi:hypothetical protein